MTKHSVEQSPSETASMTALRRTIANRVYKNGKFGPDDLAVYFLPPHFRLILKFVKFPASIKDVLKGFLPGMNEFIIARTAYFDRLFVDALDAGTPQIVLLGAGYDSRAYRFAKLNRGTRIFELDIVPTQARKMKCLQRAKIAIPQFVTFVPINFRRESLQDVLERAGWQAHQKTLFIWEGVSYYLDPGSVKATLEFVSCAHKDSTIAFDYTVPVTEENLNDYGVEAYVQLMRKHHANEELLFFIDEGEMESFLKGRNLKMVEHLDNKAIERLYLSDEDGSSLGQIIAHYRFVLASAGNHNR